MKGLLIIVRHTRRDRTAVARSGGSLSAPGLKPLLYNIRGARVARNGGSLSASAFIWVCYKVLLFIGPCGFGPVCLEVYTCVRV